MHARKLPRISEPSFDRDYGNGAGASSSKISSKNYRDRRSVSPTTDKSYGMSPRDQRSDRSGGGGKYVRNRDRDRERERERESYNKYYRGSRDSRNRDRSPKDRKSWQDHRRGGHQAGDHRGGGGGGGGRLDERGQDRGLERDRDRIDSRESGHHSQHSSASSGSSATLRSVGDWSEHTSSSGKKYYYNCVSEISRKYSNDHAIGIFFRTVFVAYTQYGLIKNGVKKNH